MEHAAISYDLPASFLVWEPERGMVPRIENGLAAHLQCLMCYLGRPDPNHIVRAFASGFRADDDNFGQCSMVRVADSHTSVVSIICTRLGPGVFWTIVG